MNQVGGGAAAVAEPDAELVPEGVYLHVCSNHTIEEWELVKYMNPVKNVCVGVDEILRKYESLQVHDLKLKVVTDITENIIIVSFIILLLMVNIYFPNSIQLILS